MSWVYVCPFNGPHERLAVWRSVEHGKPLRTFPIVTWDYCRGCMHAMMMMMMMMLLLSLLLVMMLVVVVFCGLTGEVFRVFNRKPLGTTTGNASLFVTIVFVGN